ncbi:hypothetical protein F5Y05DRAFT_335536 [Hypoxylon sp. FL0543]|nr:hypothetical protein F5Y05DRAFT_335536 [Hypoxylon sp. FL0543]
MSTSARAPKTIEELRDALRLKETREAEALVNFDPVKEAFRKYMNRCLSASSTTKQLPDWKDVDEYLLERRMSRQAREVGVELEKIVDEDCKNRPYELLPHASLFALRIMTFLKSKEGEVYDISLEDHAAGRWEDVQFDRCVRIMALLGFLVNQDRMKKAEELSRDQEIQAIMKENNWI